MSDDETVPAFVTVHLPVVRCPQCEHPYVLRLALAFDGDQRWGWFRDCQHRGRAPVGERPVREVETAPVRAFLADPSVPAID